MNPKKGLTVLYVHQLDSENDTVPNISPAIVTKVQPYTTPGGTVPSVNLRVFHSLGDFIKLDAPYSASGERGSWHFDGDPVKEVAVQS